MKRLYLLFGAAALAAAMAAPVSVKAQGPYETNRLGDNWFVGVGGGINILLDDGYDVKVGPSIDANVGKWFTPAIGIRAGYQGLSFNSVLDDVSDKYGYMYIHGDFLWNASNGIGGYREDRFWNLTPYLHTGFFRSYGMDVDGFADNEFAMGAGLLHNLRLLERLDVIIDMRATVVKGSIHGSSGPAVLPTVTAGLSYDLGWPGFTRTADLLGAVEAANAEKTAILETAIVALEAANASLEAENMSLIKRNKDLDKALKSEKAMEAAEEAALADMSPVTVYFTIGKAVLSEPELQHLDFYARNIIEKVGKEPDVEITVMGSADSNTGTAQRNKYLSEARGTYITNLLAEKYGIGKDKVTVRSEVVKAAEDPALERAVMISFN